MIGSFPILSVFGFVVMFGGVVYAITGPGSRRARPLRVDRHVTSHQRCRRIVHQPHGGSLPPSL
ncbi:hypothetical protein I553_3453 [Mycobacterium xenopi 4042]|uniref:Uncharacterized protein n=1 Tax=Mycobacterium xenopi 4042 TaxID=1299334 RepID=X7ZZA0_MYCXE|nr:hypothetical protein I553_3453 [Mycobacterium xenopi 4042]